jgi:SAM-dependent methyltransferase
MNATLSDAKRILREHAYSRSLYALLGREWTRWRISLSERAFGRYHTAARFDRLFARASDPWGYRDDPVSEERRALILRTLPRDHYPRLLELGCAEGWMTLPLSTRAAELVAADISRVALERARERCRHVETVRFVQLDLLIDPLVDTFDGIVCAGVLVFLPATEQQEVRDRLVASLAVGGDLLLEHTRKAYPGEMAGNEIHDSYRQHPELTVMQHDEVANYAVTLLRKVAR